jgi:hypothetical protein
MTTHEKMTALMTADNARDWKTFVAEFVVIQTARKENRELVSGYRVKKVKGGYTVLFGKCDPGYGVMDAGTLYSWMARLPLAYFARQADENRAALLTA